MTETANSSEASTIKLPMKFDMGAAQEVQCEIVEAVKSGSRIVLDAENIETISTSAVQMVLSANLTMVNDLKAIQIKSPSDPFVEAFNELGLFDRFMQLEFL